MRAVFAIRIAPVLPTSSAYKGLKHTLQRVIHQMHLICVCL
jgi:hypothetical protein